MISNTLAAPGVVPATTPTTPCSLTTGIPGRTPPSEPWSIRIDWNQADSLAESSAAAIAASGLLNLSKLVQDPVYAQRYRHAALIILDTLTGSDYLADETPGWEGILKGGVYHIQIGLGVNESVMWGDHFFVEALDKALSLEDKTYDR